MNVSASRICYILAAFFALIHAAGLLGIGLAVAVALIAVGLALES